MGTKSSLSCQSRNFQIQTWRVASTKSSVGHQWQHLRHNVIVQSVEIPNCAGTRTIRFIYLFISSHCLWRGVCSLELFVLRPTIWTSLASPSLFDLWSTLPRNETFSAHIHCPPSARLCSIWLSCGWCTATIVVVCAASCASTHCNPCLQDWMTQCRIECVKWSADFLQFYGF